LAVYRGFVDLIAFLIQNHNPPKLCGRRIGRDMRSDNFRLLSHHGCRRAAAAPDGLFVFGMDDKGRPRGARFAQHNDRVVNAALDLT